MHYITQRAISLTRYLIKKGRDPNDAINIAVDKFKYKSEFNQKQLIEEIKKEFKEYYGEQ